LREHCEGVLSALSAFRDSFQQVLPPLAIAYIDNFIEKNGGLIHDASGGQDLLEERVWAALILLGTFESEMSFILSDTQEIIRARSERAFAHLQRSIVADPDFRKKWQNAFAAGELTCEALGAIHLLLHGIFAFKVNAEGERTDLVFQDHACGVADEQRYVDGVVLTEWKKSSSATDAESKFADARSQAKRYAQGSLGGVELTTYRYLVVVSEKQVQPPDDYAEGSVTYRHINIAVDPATPSRKTPGQQPSKST
jgi:hypothetical protein